MEKRITELEVKLAFAEDLLETLNQTVFRQQEQIDRMQQELRSLRQHMLQAPQLEAEQRSLREEIPPHY
jgi:SlyX protein